MILRGLYAILLGIFLALFVGIGINTFYPEEVYETSTACMVQAPSDKIGSPAAYSPRQCQKDQQVQQEKNNFHSQVISSVALIFAVIYFVISFVALRNQQIFSYGFLFGCMFTLLYSLIRGFNSNHAWFAFIIVVISLILVMAIGYLRFVKQEAQMMSTKKKNQLYP